MRVLLYPLRSSVPSANRARLQGLSALVKQFLLDCTIHMATKGTLTFFAAQIILAFLVSSVPFAKANPEVSIPKRLPWTTSRITGSPDPPLPYVTERVFPALKFHNCLDIVPAPGSDRLFVVEQAGKIFSFPSKPDVESADLAVDFAEEIADVREVYALAFHPDFAQNRYCYVCYIKAPGRDDGTHVARFRVTETDPPTIDIASEQTIITWLSGGHNGCCLKFGPDGYLYISTGDGVGPNPPDTRQTGQDIRDLLSSILRIDVDHADEGRNYRIPTDNPFVEFDGRGVRCGHMVFAIRGG